MTVFSERKILISSLCRKNFCWIILLGGQVKRETRICAKYKVIQIFAFMYVKVNYVTNHHRFWAPLKFHEKRKCFQLKQLFLPSKVAKIFAYFRLFLKFSQLTDYSKKPITSISIGSWNKQQKVISVSGVCRLVNTKGEPLNRFLC